MLPDECLKRKASSVQINVLNQAFFHYLLARNKPASNQLKITAALTESDGICGSLAVY